MVAFKRAVYTNSSSLKRAAIPSSWLWEGLIWSAARSRYVAFPSLRSYKPVAKAILVRNEDRARISGSTVVVTTSLCRLDVVSVGRHGCSLCWAGSDLVVSAKVYGYKPSLNGGVLALELERVRLLLP